MTLLLKEWKKERLLNFFCLSFLCSLFSSFISPYVHFYFFSKELRVASMGNFSTGTLWSRLFLAAWLKDDFQLLALLSEGVLENTLSSAPQTLLRSWELLHIHFPLRLSHYTYMNGADFPCAGLLGLQTSSLCYSLRLWGGSKFFWGAGERQGRKKSNSKF